MGPSWGCKTEGGLIAQFRQRQAKKEIATCQNEFHQPSIWSLPKTMILRSGHPGCAGCESSSSTDRSGEADHGTDHAALVVAASNTPIPRHLLMTRKDAIAS